ncbi:MAG: hypothetical protein LBK13_02750 [Spirochaetales bacterium]|nr:hypothetical protein [Spirochaetales bacterium]
MGFPLQSLARAPAADKRIKFACPAMPQGRELEKNMKYFKGLHRKPVLILFMFFFGLTTCGREEVKEIKDSISEKIAIEFMENIFDMLKAMDNLTEQMLANTKEINELKKRIEQLESSLGK